MENLGLCNKTEHVSRVAAVIRESEIAVEFEINIDKY